MAAVQKGVARCGAAHAAGAGPCHLAARRLDAPLSEQVAQAGGGGLDFPQQAFELGEGACAAGGLVAYVCGNPG